MTKTYLTEIKKKLKQASANTRKRAIRTLYYNNLKEGPPYSRDVKIFRAPSGSQNHFVSRIKNVAIYTNRLSNISFVCKGRLISEVSLDSNTVKDSFLHTDERASEPNTFVKGTTGPKRIRKSIALPIASIYAGGGSVQYYPWMVDCLPRLKLMKDAGIDPERYFLWGCDTKNKFHNETLLAFGFDLKNVIDVNDFQHFRTIECIATSHPATASPLHPEPWIIDFLRDNLLKLADRSHPISKSGLIFLSRKDAGGRNLINEDELFDLLKTLGFERFTMSDLSVASQVKLFGEARIIVGVHGAAFTNLCFERLKPLVIEIFNKNYMPNMYESICSHRKMDYRSISADQENDGPVNRFSNLKISNSDIAKIGEMIRARLSVA